MMMHEKYPHGGDAPASALRRSRTRPSCSPTHPEWPKKQRATHSASQLDLALTVNQICRQVVCILSFRRRWWIVRLEASGVEESLRSQIIDHSIFKIYY